MAAIGRLRTFLSLSRFARLPTVWSNCLAGWWLGGGGNSERLPLLFGAASLLFLGGAFLNNSFDAEYDREHRPARPIPSGTVKQRTVFRWSLVWLIAGVLLLLLLGERTGMLGLVLVFLIVVYNTVHRLLVGAPFLKGLGRFWLYILGASVGEQGVTGSVMWCGLALAAYVAGLVYLARWQEKPGQAQYWPVALLVIPILLAMVMDVGRYREPALLLSALLVLWSLRALRQTFWSSEPNVRRTVRELGAGIVFVDWLATCPLSAVLESSNHAPRELSYAFIGLFLGVLALQALEVEDGQTLKPVNVLNR